METYIHTLIAVDANFAPEPVQVTEFISWIATQGGLDPTSTVAPQPGFRIIRPSTQMRTYKDPWTGETKEVPGSDQINLRRSLEISSVIKGIQHYSALASGEWQQAHLPFPLYQPDGNPFRGPYYGQVNCQVRATPVSMSFVDPDMRLPFENEVRTFGKPFESPRNSRLFSNPWNGARIEADGARYARFWIEFEFGDFLLPKIEETFDIMNPAIVGEAERCFGIKFGQGWTCF